MTLIGKLPLGLAVTSARLFAFEIVVPDPTFGLNNDPVTEQGFVTLLMGDFLIQQGGFHYGVVLSPHDNSG